MATNNGTANTYPIITLEGPGLVHQIINYTTKEFIFFDLELQSGEKAKLDLRPGKKTFISSFRGNIINTILSGSDTERFHLMPGNNDVSIFIDDASAAAKMNWNEYHLSFDGVVA